MNLRCSYCQTLFTLGRLEKLAALQEMYAKNLNHYDAHCPRCRRATPVPRQKLEMTMPNWREALKQLEQEWAVNPLREAPLPAPAPAPVPAAESKPEHRKRAGKPVAAAALNEKPVQEGSATGELTREEPAAKKPAKKKATAAEKPAQEKSAKEKPASKKPAAEKPATGNPAKQPKATTKQSK